MPKASIKERVDFILKNLTKAADYGF